MTHWSYGDNESLERPKFVFWVAHNSSGLSDFTLRCTAGGTKIDDIATSDQDGNGSFEAIQRTQSGKDKAYAWTQLTLSAAIQFGRKEDSKRVRKPDWDKVAWLVDHPGEWTCGLRKDGQTVRELRFTVNDKGMIQQDAIQSGKGATPTLPDTVNIDIRIPKDSKLDIRVRPDVMKKSRGFGLPWPDHPNVKTIQAAMPAASGLPDPK